MKLSTLCAREVVGIPANASLHDAATLMCEQHVGALVVLTTDDPPQVVGIVTDRDLAIDGFGRLSAEPGVRVGDLVRGRPVAVPSSAGIREAAASMEEAGVRRLLVVDDDGGVVGVVSADDILRALADDLARLAAALRNGIERERHERQVVTLPERSPIVFPPMGTVAMQ